MNSLSWLIYLADVVPSVSHLITALSLLTLLIVFVLLVVAGLTTESRWDTAKVENQKAAFRNFVCGKFLKITIPICVIGLFVAVLIPSKTTLYLIAGSEAGETIVTSKEGQEVLNDIKTIIKQQIKSYKD